MMHICVGKVAHNGGPEFESNSHWVGLFFHIIPVAAAASTQATNSLVKTMPEKLLLKSLTPQLGSASSNLYSTG